MALLFMFDGFLSRDFSKLMKQIKENLMKAKLKETSVTVMRNEVQ
jgi:hypothetical protein